MIVSWLTGGLGNQMFQYAAGLALARHRGTELKLDASWYDEAPRKPHERYALGAFNLTVPFATAREVAETRGVRPGPARRLVHAAQRAIGIAPPAGNWHAPPTFAFYPEFFEQPGHTYLHGMFQSERFFAPVAETVRKDFQLRAAPPPAIAALAERIRRGPSAFVHFRRGDYVHDPKYAREMGSVGGDYYTRALASFRARQPGATVYVFSDDIETVAREAAIPGPHEFVREPAGTAAHDVLRLMSLCDHAIIANSTLGWWGAWLGEKPGRTVIGPRRWFGAESVHDARDVLPERWEAL